MVDEWEAWEDLCNIPADPPAARELCDHCLRPRAVCWCWALPAERLRPRGRVVLLQHPAEQRRCLRTARMLQLALAPGRCLLYRGKRFPLAAHERDRAQPPLRDILARADTVLLYPTDAAVDIKELAAERERESEEWDGAADGAGEGGGGYNLVILDGTWPQAKAMFASSAALRNVRAAKLLPERCSSYVIRTQPARGCLSTLESAAEALAALERAPHYRAALLAPLHALCRYQLQCGAVSHHSRDLLPQRADPPLVAKRLARLLRPAVASAIPPTFL